MTMVSICVRRDLFLSASPMIASLVNDSIAKRCHFEKDAIETAQLEQHTRAEVPQAIISMLEAPQVDVEEKDRAIETLVEMLYVVQVSSEVQRLHRRCWEASTAERRRYSRKNC